MLARRTWVGILSLLALSLAGSYGARSLAGAPARGAVTPVSTAAPPRSSGPLRWLIAGGGPSPALNQVQLEQDVELARQVLAPRGPGLVLFAGGPGGRTVQVLDEARPPTLADRLGALFDPRGGRDARYRAPSSSPDGAATQEAILAALEGTLMDGPPPLTLYLAGHGVGGEAPRESRFATWGGEDLWVEDLAERLDRHPGHRPVRIVVTACYAGGFAELAFRAADPEQGAAETDRCGLFATTWDRVAAGCDPSPDRGAQEGYGIHFLHALLGRDRDARITDGLDLDGDGAVSLLEAHTRARIASGSLDVPVTTSEIYLRDAVDAESDLLGAEPFVSPEERAVIETLGARLELPDASAVRARLATIEREVTPLAARLDELEAELAQTREALMAALLHRWPVLDDPWHPTFARTLAEGGADIEAFLESSALAAREAELEAAHAEVADAHDRRLVALAPVERLARAYETARLAGQLRAEGGRAWLRYESFLACERGLP